MDTFIYIVVVLAFAYIVYKRKIAPILSLRKGKGDAKKGKADIKTTPSDSLPDTVGKLIPCGTNPVYGGYMSGGTCTRYTVLVFDYAESVTALEFSDVIELRLTNTLSRIVDLGCPYRVEYIPLATALVVLISYVITNPPLQAPQTPQTPA